MVFPLFIPVPIICPSQVKGFCSLLSLQIKALITKYFYLPHSSSAEVWGCCAAVHMQWAAQGARIISSPPGWGRICARAVPRWFLCRRASAIKKKLLNDSNSEEQWAITGCSDRVITVYFLVQSCYEQDSYLPACFICQHPVINWCCKAMNCSFYSKGQFNEMTFFFSNGSVESFFSIFIINLWGLWVLDIYLSSLVMTQKKVRNFFQHQTEN